ncbi:TIR domain-containing protein [Bradyrhizobium ontarionense]|uniref:TIR domain-containing protein n=1 Tax=Bradyrhizobium ontarionense TaxID=2898149 RepID=A0ABY3RLD1_9BRAD|nr:TIR domain-containing protein [Bradyrhizobium sp. A19]UFZ07661.1 TIR domain-containing protein [Bradyrhizobium sp. A19]
MSYTHDIFISYRRNPETLAWIRQHFLPLLTLRVDMELGRAPTVFIDEQVETGTSWPQSLGTALGCSRTLIALWTGNYLSSVWCSTELSHMVAREQEAQLRTAQRPHGVVIPAFIHDGNRFPAELSYMQRFEIQQCFNVRMASNSPRAEELDAVLTAQAPAIAACIEHAPAFRKSWPQAAIAKMYQKFHERAGPVQTTVPRFTAP